MERYYWETAPKVTVATGDGPVRGLIKDGMRRFLGIPYAAPPVGSLRWRPPTSPDTWQHPRTAFEYGNVCAQINDSFPGFGFSSNTEDCLYLNVFAPEGVDASAKLPVMVWIPGGGLFVGGSTGYDPSALVTQGDIVFVSINYRVSVFGFFSHPAINAEDHPIGNYGLLDQQAALRWVQTNIAGFGGDPDNVTISGESAGGISVWCQLASPASRGLFHKAIVQSGTAHPLIDTPRTVDFEETGRSILRNAGIADNDQTAEALRAVPTTDLLAATQMSDAPLGLEFEIGHSVDGAVIPEPLVDLFTSGRFHRVPTINGTTRSEFNWFQAMIELATGPIPNAAYEPVMRDLLAQLPMTLIGMRVPPERLPDVLDRYPATAGRSAAETISAAIGDCGFINLGNRATNRVLKQYVDDVYAYEFDAPDGLTPWPTTSFPHGSCHTKDLQFLFQDFGGSGGHAIPHSAAEADLASALVEYWTNFVHFGTPNAASSALPTWHPLDPSRDNAMLLTTPACHEVEELGNRHHGDLWDDIAATQPHIQPNN